MNSKFKMVKKVSKGILFYSLVVVSVIFASISIVPLAVALLSHWGLILLAARFKGKEGDSISIWKQGVVQIDPFGIIMSTIDIVKPSKSNDCIDESSDDSVTGRSTPDDLEEPLEIDGEGFEDTSTVQARGSNKYAPIGCDELDEKVEVA